jgi:lipopolysaccharide export LptBFGC system permease protein LptF
VYYIVLTVFSFVSQTFIGLAPLWAWMPNIIFTAIGLARLRRASAV